VRVRVRRRRHRLEISVKRRAGSNTNHSSDPTDDASTPRITDARRSRRATDAIVARSPHRRPSPSPCDDRFASTRHRVPVHQNPFITTKLPSIYVPSIFAIFGRGNRMRTRERQTTATVKVRRDARRRPSERRPSERRGGCDFISFQSRAGGRFSPSRSRRRRAFGECEGELFVALLQRTTNERMNARLPHRDARARWISRRDRLTGNNYFDRSVGSRRMDARSTPGSRGGRDGWTQQQQQLGQQQGVGREKENADAHLRGGKSPLIGRGMSERAVNASTEGESGGATKEWKVRR